jgi:hypothetical protein
MPLVLNGTTGVQDNSGAFVAGTAVASTSGTSIDFTGIPSWVKRITVVFNQVSTNGTSVFLLQLGDSGGIENTGYFSTGFSASSGGSVSTSPTTGFALSGNNVAPFATSGITTLVLLNNNQWILSSSATQSAGQNSFASGDKTLSATLDRIRITTVNGTDVFDAGAINILYE